MDMKSYKHRKYTNDRFTQPPCYELAGESFHFVMDGGYAYWLELTGETSCLWSLRGEPPKSSDYQCLKADDSTYLLTYELANELPRTSHTLVIDREQRLVTLLTCMRGLDPRHPYRVTSSLDFGAIEKGKKKLPEKRHCLSDEMLGTSVKWRLDSDLTVKHAYLEGGFQRSSASRGLGASPKGSATEQYVKIKDKMFLFVFTEEPAENDESGAPLRSGSMVYLQNYERMIYVGRCFGTLESNGRAEDTKYMFGAFGEPDVSAV